VNVVVIMNTGGIDQEIVSEILSSIEKELGTRFIRTKSINKRNVRRSRLFLELHSADNPKYLLKLYTAQNYKDFLGGFERYKTMYKTIPDNLKANLAEPVLNNEHRGVYFCLEGCLEGKPLKPFLENRLISFKRKQSAISQCLTWLVSFKKAFDSIDIHSADLLVNLKQYRDLFDCTEKELFLLDLLEQRISSGNFENRYFLQHGDLSIENLLISRETFGIFDWELTGSETIPHHDLFVFLTTGIYSIEHCFDKNRERGFRNIFLKDRNRNLFVKAINSYAKGLNIDSNFSQFFFPYYLVTLPVVLNRRRSSSLTIATARKNVETYAIRHEEIDELLTI